MALSIATFNVKDLLEPRTDREREVLPAKLDFLARTLAACDADVVGLQEIGPPELLEAVLQRLPARGGYGEPVVGTADARGIRCALLSRRRVVEARVHTADALTFPVFREGDPQPFGTRIPLRRGVVHARVEAPWGGTVDVLVAHFKSSRPVPARDAAGEEMRPLPRDEEPGARGRAEAALRSLVWRAAEALHVRGLVDGIMAGERGALKGQRAEGPVAAGAHVAVVGDLNDVPDSTPVRTVRGDVEAVETGARRADVLFDCAARIEARARFSVLHDGRATQIDHVLASGPLYARLEDAAFLNADLRQHPPVERGEPPEPRPDSDHAPLVARFE
jgi:endonuclease/exonuclease/phosphatase family metal-dependent hydrolase